MSRAEKFISDCTRNCSNEILSPYPQIINDVRRIGGEPAKEFSPWLTPDQARRAVEIAREEIYEWLRANLCDYFDVPRKDYDMCLDDLKNSLKK